MTPPRNSDEDGQSSDFLLGKIHAQNEMILRTLSEDRLADAQFRTEVWKKLDDLSERMTKAEGAQKSIAEDVAEMKPKVNHLEERRNQAVGAMHMGRWIWGALGGGTVAGIISGAQYLLGKHQ